MGVLVSPKPLAYPPDGREAYASRWSEKSIVSNQVNSVNTMRNYKNKSIKNRGGRPTKGITEKLKYRITVKMATSEYYALKTKAKESGLSISELVREALNDCSVKARLTVEQADHIRKLCGMANNVNQLAHQANIHGFVVAEVACKRMVFLIEKLIDLIRL